jgi:hypothetical protein
MKEIKIIENFKIPGTNILLEKGDIIQMQEAGVTNHQFNVKTISDREVEMINRLIAYNSVGAVTKNPSGGITFHLDSGSSSEIINIVLRGN